MALQVEWTLNALGDYSHTVDYLLEEWSLRVADDFITNIENRVQQLSLFPYAGIASLRDSSIRSIVVTKHNRLYYRILPEKIEILAIFDTRQHPKKNKYG